MNKYKNIIIGLVVCLLLSGCGASKEKTLSCTGEMEGMNTNVSIKFDKKGVFEDAKLEMVYKVEEEILKVMDIQKFSDTIKSSMESEMDEASNMEVTNNGKDTINIKFNVGRDDFEETMNVDDETYDDVKKSLEDEGFTCK